MASKVIFTFSHIELSEGVLWHWGIFLLAQESSGSPQILSFGLPQFFSAITDWRKLTSQAKQMYDQNH